MMHIELEQALDTPMLSVATGTGVTIPTPQESGWKGFLYGVASLVVTTGIAYLLKQRSRAGDALDDAAKDADRGQIQRQDERLKLLEDSLRDNLQQQLQGAQQLHAAHAASLRAQLEAETAQRAASDAAAAAQRARSEAEALRLRLVSREGYIIRLKETLVAHGITIPPDPDPV